MEIFSAGTSGTTAEQFFRRLKSAGVSAVVDTRRNNVSQLAGFSKFPDIEFFSRELAGARYVHELLLAPESDALKAYRNKTMSWGDYEDAYISALSQRDVANVLDPALWGESPLLLCSEPTVDRCHRRLAADFLSEAWGQSAPIAIRHI